MKKEEKLKIGKKMKRLKRFSEWSLDEVFQYGGVISPP